MVYFKTKVDRQSWGWEDNPRSQAAGKHRERVQGYCTEGRASTNLGIEDIWREEGQGKDTCCTKHVFIIFSLGALVSKPL